MNVIISLINTHKSAYTGFVLYRWPGGNDINYLAGKHTENHKEGFPFTAFNTDSTKSLFLEAEVICRGKSIRNIFDQVGAATNTNLALGSSEEKDTSISTYEKGFNSLQKDIANGSIKKAILSRKKIHSFSLNDLDELFENTLKSHPLAMVYCFYHPLSGLWIGASPELIVEKKGELFTTVSLAGTKTSTDLPWRKKEITEQNIVPTFITKSLESIEASYQLGEIKTVQAGKIYHLKQLIEFKLPKGNLLDILEMLHPTPAIGGHPKKAAYLSIKNAEKHKREYYCGYLGEVNDKHARLYVNLRCMRIYDNQIEIFVGGGITKDSEVKSEWSECERKASTCLEIIP